MLSFFIFLSGVLSLILVRKHFLLSLLSLEFVILSIFFFMYYFFYFCFFDFFFGVVFLVLGVCEGVLGLSLIVFLFRSSDNCYVDNLVLC
uniref:NADH-ubiquinone oxidoreductase chain 4L n=2 Tax=Ricania TaxID=130626 RepID=A0A1C9JBZ2_9HEMI|nr:NADH dehydrogenase subunit 4L [Ricania speculum]AEO18323.1 NADH dehydrogenase subunit 4L [Ricania marginalis]AOP19364.1 NADH dehydrogenase subunit 4L [Ricania speculum]QNV47330.1 NADH dehydrogenase subunit 4L [Ricania speculum]